MIGSLVSHLMLGLALLAPVVRAQCDLSLLKSVTSRYVAAQSTGKFRSLHLSRTSVYTENFQPVDISSGILSQPLKIDHNRSIHDTSACATYTELIVTDPTHPYVIGTQIRLPTRGNTRKILQINSIVTDAGDWLFNATNTLYWSTTESWSLIPAAKRDTRETLKNAADAYLNKFNNNSIVVPFGIPCARLEGGAYTGSGLPTDNCDIGFPTGIPMLNRRYVIDPRYGSVEVFFNFGGPTHSPDSHQFRLEGGKIRFVHTMTALKCQAIPEDPCNAW